jgi:antibiotic biosynthesis monooxygenase (ABM) superfamily enzyme
LEKTKPRWNVSLIILSDGIYSLVVVTKEMLQNITLLTAVDCFELCDILRLKLTTYYDAPINRHVMNDGSGDLYGCICQ